MQPIRHLLLPIMSTVIINNNNSERKKEKNVSLPMSGKHSDAKKHFFLLFLVMCFLVTLYLLVCFEAIFS